MRSPPTSLVVSLHDVSVLTRPACATILHELRALGIRTCSLLVIPNHHQRGHFLSDLACCQWLKDQAAAGHEIVVHGYHHQRLRREKESVAAKFATRFYTADEAEFFDLDRGAAADLLQKARGDFAQLGLKPRGFIAPGWLLGADAESALRELEWDYTTRIGSVIDLRDGRRFRSQSAVWSVRAGWRRLTSLAWNALLARLSATNSLLRVAIHPADASHPQIWQQIRRLLARALAEREPLTYDAWIQRQRSSSVA